MTAGSWPPRRPRASTPGCRSSPTPATPGPCACGAARTSPWPGRCTGRACRCGSRTPATCWSTPSWWSARSPPASSARGRSSSTTTRPPTSSGWPGRCSFAEVGAPPGRERFVSPGWFDRPELVTGAEGPAPRLEKLGRPLIQFRGRSGPAGPLPEPVKGDQALPELEGAQGGQAGRWGLARPTYQEPGNGGQGDGDGLGVGAGGHRVGGEGRLRVGAALHGHGGQQQKQVDPGRPGARPRPVDGHHPGGGEQQFVGPRGGGGEGGPPGGRRPAGLQGGQPVEVAGRP